MFANKINFDGSMMKFDGKLWEKVNFLGQM